jgi:hypothetical protein
MNRIAAGIAAIGLGLAMSTVALADVPYSATATVEFNWATDGLALGWTSSAANTLAAISNDTYFSTLPGNNSTTYYNADFAKNGDAAGWCGPGTESFQAQYACKISTVTPVADVGPGAKATGTLTITDTTMVGTLTVINTNDEGLGPQTDPVATAATGYNVRSADGSPFKNVWYGFSNTTTLAVNLTGTFTATSWAITGGTVAFFDSQFQCRVADFSGVLCNPSTVGGGFQANGQGLSWGMSQGDGPATGVTQIKVFDPAGANQIATLAGVLASLSIDGAGNITTAQGETRVGTGSSGGGCPTSIRYSDAGDTISCGTLQVRKLNVTGTVAGGGVASPDTFPDFPDQTDVPVNSVRTSSAVTVLGATGPWPISVTGGEYAIGGCTPPWLTDPSQVSNGSAVCVRQTSAALPATTTDTVLTIGGATSTFSVTTLPADTTPEAFSFTAQTGVPLSTPVTSNTVTISGINAAAPISITGGEYRIGAGAFTSTAGTVVSGDQVTVRQTSSGLGSTTTTATLNVGGVTAGFDVTTVVADTSPDPINFGSVLDAPLSSVQTSNTVTITGINVATPISITGGEYRIGAGAFTSTAGTVLANDQVTVRQTSSASPETTTNAALQVGDQAAAFSVTTGDTTPLPFTFTDVTNQPLNTLTPSNSVTIFGITLPSPISIVGGEYSINTGVFTSTAGTVTSGQQVVVRQTSSGTPATTTNTVLTVGGVSDTFAVTTVPVNQTPDQFTFVDQTGVALNTAIISNSVTVTGINAAAPISIVGGQYSIGAGAFTAAAGTVVAGDTVRVQVTSANAASTATTATLSIGPGGGGVVSDTFSVTTSATPPDTQPTQFFFEDVPNADLGEVVESNEVTVTGIDSPARVRVTGPAGTNFQYRIEGGAWTSADGQITSGQTLQVRHTAASVPGRAVTTTVTIGIPPAGPPGTPNTTSFATAFSSLTTPPGDGGSSSMDLFAIGLLGGLAFLRRRSLKAR